MSDTVLLGLGDDYPTGATVNSELVRNDRPTVYEERHTLLAVCTDRFLCVC